MDQFTILSMQNAAINARKKKHKEDFHLFDKSSVLKWDDKKLADWQSDYHTDDPQWIFVEHEWKRRAGISTRRIAIAAIVVSVLSLIVAALGYFHSLNGDSTPAPLKSPAQSGKQSQSPTPSSK